MKIKKELLLFSIGIIAVNSFLFVFAVFILSQIEGIDNFQYAIIATLFLFTTTGSIYLVYSLADIFYAPIKNFKFLIENTMHELNTPVATIKTNTLMLKKTANEAELKRISRIELACEKLLELYENLEYFAKKEAKLDQKTLFNAKEAIEVEIALIEESFLKKGIELKVELESKNIFTDKKGFSLALANLLSNALKFTATGAVEVTFKDNILSVKDSGCGIANDELIKIFERYYQQNSSGSGHGIGLFLVKEFCDDNGVDLFIRSEVGCGSEFTLDFGKISKKF